MAPVTLSRHLVTLADVVGWFAELEKHGGVPHPDDSAWQTCDDIHGHRPRPDWALLADCVRYDGHIAIHGPLFDEATPAEAKAYDATMSAAWTITGEAGVDIYQLAMDANLAREEVDLGPVLDEDGEPTAVTREILVGKEDAGIDPSWEEADPYRSVR